MKGKKLLCFGMAAALACAGLPGMTAPARELWAAEESGFGSGFVGGDLRYEVLLDGTLMVTGYTGDGAEVEIPSEIEGKSVTYIGKTAFRNCRSLTSIRIPSSVTRIMDCAFENCSSLTSISIPAGVTSIYESAFWGCRSLTSIQVAEENENYASEDGVLYGKGKTDLIRCPEGKEGSLEIPAGVTSIRVSAFLNCSGLSDIRLSAGVTSIGAGAFSGCSSLTSISIPASVASIGGSAFSVCSSLADIQVAEGNENYASDDGLLYDKGKTELICCPLGKMGAVSIPASVTSIGYDSAFQGCGGLTGIQVAEGNESYTSEDGVLYDKEKTSLICCPEGKTGSVSIPASVTGIRGNGFLFCSSLTGIQVAEGNESYASEDGVLYDKGKTSLICCPKGKAGSVGIPASVTSVGIGFSWCGSLTDIQVVEENGTYASENGLLYNKEKTSLICCPGGKAGSVSVPVSVTSIGDRAFMGCGGLTGIRLPASVTSIGSSAFNSCSSLTGIRLPAEVTSIKESVFYNCNSLTSIRLPAGVTSIGWMAFSGCEQLKDVYYAGSEEQWKNISIQEVSSGGVRSDSNRYLVWATKHYNSSDTDDNEDGGDSGNNGNGGTGDSGNNGNSGTGGSVSIGTETSQKKAQAITAADMTKTYGEKPFSLGASAFGGAPLSYASSNTKVASVASDGTVTVKGCGVAHITVTAKETNGYKAASKTVTLTVKPKKASLVSVKSGKKKTALVRWKRDAKASGYLIECATDKKFKKNKVQITVGKNKTVSATVKKLKGGKKYYVRVCAYAKDGKKKIQGDFSKIKTVKVKK